MQQCRECGASWNVKRIFDVCPFCGADLREKATIDSIESAFKLISERHGQNVFQSSILLGFLGDYAPSLIKERNLVKVAIEAGAYKAICLAPAAEREHVLNKYASLLTDSYFIDKAWARKALEWCIGALDSGSNIEKSIKPYDSLKPDIEEDPQADTGAAQREGSKRTTFIDPDLIISDGILKKYRGTKRSLELPATIHTIASGAFHSNNDIYEITVPASVEIIKKSAFAYCENLENIAIESGVKQIEDWAFVNCKKLSRIIIPDSVICIGQYAFQGCSELVTIRLSNEITEIQEGTFFDCRSLTSVSFPKKLRAIRRMSFKNCKSIETILLPEHLEIIEADAFSSCWSLKIITVTSNIMIDPKTFDRLYGSDMVEIKYQK